VSRAAVMSGTGTMWSQDGYVEEEIRVAQSDSLAHYGCRLRTALGDEIHETEHWQRYAQG